MNLENMISPPWKMFEMPQTSMGWRMGGGEDYLMEWHKWFNHMVPGEQQAYIALYPEPEDWFEFYSLCLAHQRSGSQKEINAILERAGTLRTTYCKQLYELGVFHEEAGHDEHALESLGKVIFCIRTWTIGDDVKTGEIIKRYAIVKQRFAQHMTINPIIREGWNALRQSEQRTLITPRRTRVTTEDYARMQQDIFFPSELGRTWIHCFEDDILYIHRHWREPCLFLVVLEPAEQGYRITEAWMNDDPAIPRPLTRPPMEPGLLLTRLLSRFLKG